MNPHNMKYTFGDDLKEQPDDVVDFKRGIDYLIQKMNKEEAIYEKAKLLSSIGVNQRIAGLLEASLQHLLQAKKIWQGSSHERIWLINEIRLAQTYQFLKQFEQAEAIYKCVEDYITAHPTQKNLLHFVYQHKGKNYFDQSQYNLAEVSIQKALQIRMALNDESLVESSVFALGMIGRKIKDAI